MSLVFSDFFFMKSGDHRAGFSRKMSFAQKTAQNGLKWTVSIISQNGVKVKVIFISDILHDVKGR